MKSFGEVLKGLRIEKKMTQGMLSEDICSQSVLSRVENNEELPNIRVMFQLCERLGVSVDSVLSHDESFIQESNALLNQLGMLIYGQDSKQLTYFIEKNKIERELFLESDLQRYYFYIGVYEYSVQHDNVKSMELFNISLRYTYNKAKKMLTPIEVVILSYIGRLYISGKKFDQGKELLERSYQGLFFLPNSRRRFEHAIVFYNYAEARLEMNENDLAEDMVNQGIQWEIDRMSYYLIDKFCMLKSKLIAQKGNENLATLYYERAIMIEQMIQLDVFKETIKEREE